MSDEDQMEDWSVRIDKRISELEKKFEKHVKDSAIDRGNIAKEYLKDINDLRIRVGSHQQNFNIYRDSATKRFKEIAELRASSASHTEEFKVIFRGFSEGYDRQIAELNKRVDNKTDINFVGGLLKLRDDEIAKLRENQIKGARNRNKIIGKLNELRAEVLELREYSKNHSEQLTALKALEHRIGDFTDVDFIELKKKFKQQAWADEILQAKNKQIKEVLRVLLRALYSMGNLSHKYYHSLLAKLDVGSASKESLDRQPVDPCLDCKTQVYCDECDHMEKAINSIPKDSGGEKVRSAAHTECEHQWDTVEPIECIICGIHKEKPPEPKHDYCPQYEGDFDKEDRLPGGTGVVVKREDLLVDIKILRECKSVECVTCDGIMNKWEERLSDATDKGGVRD